MKHGLPWYKHNPREFMDGVQGLGADVIGAYIIIIDLIYARGGETKRDDYHLAGILGCSKRLATSLTDRLIELGKVVENGDFITNSRAETEVSAARAEAERRVEAQRVRREKEAASNKNNDLFDKRDDVKPPREDKIRQDSKKAPSSPKKGTRIPDDFAPDLDAAIELGMQPQAAISEAAKFRDYWTAAAGAKGVKLDWPATWRNWVRSSLDRNPRLGSRAPPAKPKTEFQSAQDRIKAEMRGTNDERNRDDQQPDLDLRREDFYRS